MIQRRERKERSERKETRISRDVKTFVGWKYIEQLVNLSTNPELIMALFLTGGRATEVLELRQEHFAEYDDYYEVVGMPVFKRFDIVEKYIDSFGKKRWKTELVMERRTFPILKSEKFSTELWEYSQKCEDKLFHFPEVKDQYWQVYKVVHQIEAPKHPYAPENIYPHWFRGQRAAQLRVEYGLSIDKIMDFFGWKSLATAKHYAGMSSRDIADAMIEGKMRRNQKIVMPVPELVRSPKEKEKKDLSSVEMFDLLTKISEKAKN